MSWTDQTPTATEVVFQGRTYSDKHFEIDKLPNGQFRITVGNLFGSQEVCRNASLEDALLLFAERDN